MKKLTLVVVACVAAALVASWLIVSMRNQGHAPKPDLFQPGSTAEESGLSSETVNSSAPAQSRTAPVTAAANPAEAAPPRIETIQAEDSLVRIVRVPAGRALASVNGTAISLKDLLPMGAGVEQVMSPETYEFLLNRAVERELSFQAASAQRIELSDEQRRTVEQVRQRMLERENQEGVVHLNRSGKLEDQIAFETRDATSQLLLNSLLTKAGAASPHVTENQVKQYYERHHADFAALPSDASERAKAWQQIDLAIRQKLVLENTAEHQAQRQHFLDSLRAKAAITIVETSQ